ncbi:TlpA family protein disulfide reductase [Prevotella sp. 10(H)]|uniref:TlpA family protein disulfide reductase n=1 Tax=Prevotella sp. 10(H) TaxID=1158294 RepID=UPI0018CC14D2|nr:TlpA family protein disulfide reductase [Prevotella sp. 10(H)]
MRKVLIIFLLSLLFFILISPFRGEIITFCNLQGVQTSSIVGMIGYYFITLVLIIRYEDKIPKLLIIISIFLGASIFSLPLYIFDLKHNSTSFLEYIIRILSILLAFLCSQIKTKKSRVWFTIISLNVCLWLSTIGYNFWNYKLAYGTFRGKVSDDNIYNLTFDIANNTKVSINEFKGKYLIVDCWFTYCNGCYEEFPKVQQLYNKYKNDGTISIYSCHSRIESYNENVSTGNEILRMKGFDLPSLSVNIYDTILKEIGVKSYPTVLIFDKNSKLIYRGDIDGAEKLINKLTMDR